MNKQPFKIDGLDPFDPNLTKDQQMKIMDTVRREPHTFYLLIVAAQMRNMGYPATRQ